MKKDKFKIKKEYVIITVATIVPFGFVALGIYKIYELLNKKEENEKTNTNK